MYNVARGDSFSIPPQLSLLAGIPFSELDVEREVDVAAVSGLAVEHLEEDRRRRSLSIKESERERAKTKNLTGKISLPSFPLSKPSMAFMSSSVRAKSQMEKFSSMRDGVTDLGITTMSRWVCSEQKGYKVRAWSQ